MAVKGKKKSQSRGSQGRRRPAQAPRAIYGGRSHQPWYRTTAARVGAALVLLVALLGIVVVVRSGSNRGNLTQRQNTLDQYTGDVRALLQTITPAATDEDGVPNKLTTPEAKALKSQSVSWQTQLLKAQQTAGNVTAPTPGTQSANIIFGESIQLYSQAATVFGLAPSTSSRVQVKMLASAASLRNQATALWQEGVNILDQARSATQMTPSQLRIPTAGAVAPPSPTPAASPSSSSGKHKKKKNSGSGGGQ
jgi:hypothetical protein